MYRTTTTIPARYCEEFRMKLTIGGIKYTEDESRDSSLFTTYADSVEFGMHVANFVFKFERHIEKGEPAAKQTIFV